MAVRMTTAPPEALVGRRICGIDVGVYGSDDYLRSNPSPHRVIGEDDLHSPPSWAPADATVALRSNHLGFTLRAAAYGLGLARLPCFLAASEPALRLFGEPLAVSGFGLWTLTHERLREVARVRFVMDTVARALGAHRDAFEPSSAA